MSYEATYTDRDGATVSGPASVVSAWRTMEKTQAAEKRAWVADLIGREVKGAHPDDGWVDRQADSVRFCYPQFDLRPGVGDLIALGQPERYRLVRVTRIEAPSFLAEMFAERGGYRAQPRYYFAAA